jgi:hypothetical protein
MVPVVRESFHKLWWFALVHVETDGTMTGKDLSAVLRPNLQLTHDHAELRGLPEKAAGGEVFLRALAALGVDHNKRPSSRKPDLAALVLVRAYGVEGLPHFPSRLEARYGLMRKLLSALFPNLDPMAPRPPKRFEPDVFTRRLYAAFAGVEGNVLKAEAALLKSILGTAKTDAASLSKAILDLVEKERSKAGAVKPSAWQEPPPALNGAHDLDHFASRVRSLARTLETKPYSGRVAIAQVYDAAVSNGASFGSLDDFKSHLAAAAREGLIDLERYDIAGPLDAGLKERSRMRFGRDERHFIVNPA